MRREEAAEHADSGFEGVDFGVLLEGEGVLDPFAGVRELGGEVHYHQGV